MKPFWSLDVFGALLFLFGMSLYVSDWNRYLVWWLEWATNFLVVGITLYGLYRVIRSWNDDKTGARKK
ncbi:MAG: hypothetical protein WC613_05235 [Candidatus Aenigmatarchaeota archaeon]